MDKSFNPNDIERRWREEWEKANAFYPRGAGKPYCIMLPPPNVTGRLHMGHAFQDTLMDALTRYHRMQGDNTLWQCGTDHAGIATQMVVEHQLLAQGRNRHELGRAKFVESVWAWKEQSGGHITDQMRRLGASVDWSSERFTMDEGMSEAVRKVFVDLYDQGLIYRGQRLINWDPVLHTALSDLEVVSEEEAGTLWHLRYPREDGQGYVVVATTRPETMLGDTAVAVHPDDQRFRDLVGQRVRVPLTERCIPIIADDYVAPEFGTGCVKITPAHDFNDYEVGQRHQLPMINVLTLDATINDHAPEAYRGLDRFAARQSIVDELKRQGLLEKTEAHRLAVPRGDRSGAVLEPYLTDQWFVDLTRQQQEDGRPGGKTQITEPAIEAVTSGRVRFVPSNWDKTYYDWMHNIQDWCISRQLWWGHRIPAWYDSDGKIYVGLSEQDARQRHNLAEDVVLRQDPDVLDTWFSSALWPFSTLGWPQETERLRTFYPSNVLVTGFDIIFFWVARMIMMGLKFMGEVPFREVYIHGLIRDAQGQKMSKSKGNILDPIDLIDGIELEPLVVKRTTGLLQPQMAAAIEQATRKEFPEGIRGYGTDALRFTFAALATQGRDIRIDLGRIEGYRNFCNKLWNAARYVLLNTVDPVEERTCPPSEIDRWILSRLERVTAEVRTQFESYRFDLVAQALYEFTWHEYCDWYLELTKPVLADGSDAARSATRHTLLTVLEQLLRLLHPLMPFITEEIWQNVFQRMQMPMISEEVGQKVSSSLGLSWPSISQQPYPQTQPQRIDASAEADVQWLQGVLLGIRQIRGEMDIAPGKPLSIQLESEHPEDRDRASRFGPLMQRLGRIETMTWLDPTEEQPESAVALAGTLKIHIPLRGIIDPQAEIARIRKELEKHQGNRTRAEKKLANTQFTDNAPPAVVAKEQAKSSAASAAIDELQQQLRKLEKP